MLFAWAIAAMCVMPGCLSDGEETYVLEEPQLTASKMIIGGWRQSTVKAVDEDGNDVPLSSIEGIDTDKIPDISFGEDGSYTATYPDGSTETGSWNISDDDTYLNLGEESWKIYSFGENKLVLVKEIYYNGRYYYIMYIFIKVSSPEASDNGEGEGTGEDPAPAIPEFGSISDNNPYKPFGKNLVKSIESSDEQFWGGRQYYFLYDGKGRVYEYRIENSGEIAYLWNLAYNDKNVYLFLDKELIATGAIGDNGYISTLQNHKGEGRKTFFEYDGEGKLISVMKESTYYEYNPQYDQSGNMTTPETHNSSSNTIIDYDMNLFNQASINLNGMLYTSYYYPWEWDLYAPREGEVLSFFDFFGKRSEKIASSLTRTDTDFNYTFTRYVFSSIGGTSNNPDSPESRIALIKLKYNDNINQYEITYVN